MCVCKVIMSEIKLIEHINSLPIGQLVKDQYIKCVKQGGFSRRGIVWALGINTRCKVN